MSDTPRDTILVINAGSSSIKFYLYDIGGEQDLTPRLGGQIEGIGTLRPRLRVRDAAGQPLIERDIAPGHASDVPNAQEVVGTWLSGHLGGAPLAVGHRVVHGGPDLSEPVLVDDEILAQLEAYAPLAPLHQPNNLAPIRVIRERRPAIAQVACFDTAFHRSHSDVADRYAVPESCTAKACAATAFMACPTNTSRSACARSCPTSPRAGSSPRTWARACRPAPCTTAKAWTAPWASPRSKGCPWARVRAGWTPAWCCG